MSGSSFSLFAGDNRRYVLFAQRASVVLMAAGTLVLAGWWFDIAVLKSALPGGVTMKPNTAICFILSGVALWQVPRSENVNPKRQWVGQACALVSTLLGALTWGEYLWSINVGIDQFLFRKALLTTKVPFPGRMAHVTALEFIIFGISLLLLNSSSRGGKWLSQKLALLGTVISLTTLAGYVYGADALYQISAYSSVALHTALLFTLLGFAVLCARPDQGMMRTVTSTDLGGLMARKILPLAFTLPFLLGWIRLQGQHFGLYGTEFGLSIFTIANVLIFVSLISIGSKSLNKIDTERQQTAAVVQESEKRFRTMANSIPQLGWIGKADGFIYWYNQRWYEFTGTTPEQMEGWGWQSVHDPLVLPLVLEQWRASIATGEPFEMEFPLRKADGVYRSFLTRGVPLKDTKGQVVQWFGTCTDVTELKRAEDALREREEQLRLCVEHSPTAIVMLDREMKYLVVSHRWMEAYRLGEQSIVGRSHYEVMSDIPQRWIEILQRCLAGAIEKCDEDPFLRTDGTTDWVRWEVRPWRQADGAIGGIIIFSENITERKLAQEEVLRLNADLEVRVIERTMQLHAANVALDDKNIGLQKTAEAKDSFLANMSHELRTPLNGIIGFAEFLVDGKPGVVNPKQKEYLEDILNSGKHLLQLISDILDLAKVGAGKMEFFPERFSLRKVIEETCAISEPIARKRGIHINMVVAPECGDVTLDQQKFKQVLFNLLSNAIKFNHDGGKVGISVEPYDTDRVKVVISDTGIGIKVEDVGRLFNAFEQLESGASRRHEGTGLGLALTRKIVELQGGNISVESQLGKGSSFIVVLPLFHHQGQQTVLVVDDDPEVQDFLKSCLKKFGFSRIVVGTAKDAIASLRKQKFDLIFLDLQLPDAPGDQVYNAAKQIDPDLNVIVITGYPDSEMLDRILQISPVTVLKKPLKIEQLNQTVKILRHSTAVRVEP
jgi:PAS domain S-box-containing protein